MTPEQHKTFFRSVELACAFIVGWWFGGTFAFVRIPRK